MFPFAVQILLPVFLGAAALAEQTAFSNWRLQLTPFWEKTAGKTLVLSPYAQARARASRCEIRPGVPAVGPLESWFDAEFEKALGGRAPTALEPRRTTTFPRGLPGLQRVAKFGSGTQAQYLKLIVINPPESFNSILFTADDDASYRVAVGLIDSFLQTAQFEGTASTPDVARNPLPAPPPPRQAPEKVEGGVTPDRSPAEPSAAWRPEPVAGLPPVPDVSYDPEESIDWDGPEEMVKTMLDNRTFRVGSEMEEFGRSSRRLPGSVAYAAVSYDQALRTLRNLFQGTRFEPEMKRLRDSARFQNGQQLQMAAMSGALVGDFGYMLAALAVQHEKAPQDPTVLLNLAGAMAHAGFPNESQAFLEELQRTGKQPVIAWGTNPDAWVGYIRGFNLMLVGKYDEAAAQLDRSLQLEPALSEAAFALAVVKGMGGRVPQKQFLMGVWRSRAAPPMYCGMNDPEGDPFEEEKPEEEVGMPSNVVFDLSKGNRGVLPPFHHPQNPGNLLDLNQKSAPEVKAMQEAAVTWYGQLERLLPLTQVSGDPFQRAIDQAIYKALETPLLPELQKLHSQMKNAQSQLMESRSRMASRTMREMQGLVLQNLPKPVLNSRLKELYQARIDSLRSYAQAYDTAVRKHHSIWHRYATGLSAAITDPYWRELAQAYIDYNTWVHWSQILTLVGDYTAVAPVSKDVVDPDPVGGLERPRRSDIGKCTPEMKNHSFEAQLGQGLPLPTARMDSAAVSLKLSCDKVALEMDFSVLKLPGDGLPVSGKLSVFGEISLNTKGELTIYAGPKGSVELTATPNPFGVVEGKMGGSVKNGVYVTVDKSGVTDVGMKVGFSESAGSVAGTKTSMRVDEMKFTFMPKPPAPAPSSSRLQVWRN